MSTLRTKPCKRTFISQNAHAARALGRGVEEDGATYLDLVRLKRVRTLHLDERIDNLLAELAVGAGIAKQHSRISESVGQCKIGRVRHAQKK